MKEDYDEYRSSKFLKKHYGKQRVLEETSADVSILLSELVQKESEIELYKKRLKEVETAFYYNLEIISERDLELDILEKKLYNENEQLKQVIGEKNDLEELLRTFDDRSNFKIQQLETKLIIKEDKIKALQKDNLRHVNSLRKELAVSQEEQKKKICEISNSCDMEKKNIMKKCRDEIEEKENYYLFEIDKLSGELEDLWKDKEKFAQMEEEIKNLRNLMFNMEKCFRQKENNYREEMRRMSKVCRRINQESEYILKPKVSDKQCQAEPSNLNAESQTLPPRENSDADSNEQKIAFLTEQNEVLKYVIKDLKKKEKRKLADDDVPCEEKCAECKETLRLMVEEVKKKFESEIDSIKKSLQEEQTQKAEEESLIESLETNLVCLKDRLLSGLQHKFDRFSEITTENNQPPQHPQQQQQEQQQPPSPCYAQILQLEKKLSRKIDNLFLAAQKERQKVCDKLDKLRIDCLERLKTECKKTLAAPPLKDDPENDHLLNTIRQEIQKLEIKIDRDLKNISQNERKTEKFHPSRRYARETSDSLLDFDLPFAESIETFYRVSRPQSSSKSTLREKRSANIEKANQTAKFEQERQRKNHQQQQEQHEKPQNKKSEDSSLSSK